MILKHKVGELICLQRYAHNSHSQTIGRAFVQLILHVGVRQRMYRESGGTGDHWGDCTFW